RPADNLTLLRALTSFVCIELCTGRPKRMRAEFVEGYGAAILERGVPNPSAGQ
ncbi:acyl-CoA thioesterase, partial [Pseudomonas syringae pv. tagetis]